MHLSLKCAVILAGLGIIPNVCHSENSFPANSSTKNLAERETGVLEELQEEIVSRGLEDEIQEEVQQEEEVQQAEVLGPFSIKWNNKLCVGVNNYNKNQHLFTQPCDLENLAQKWVIIGEKLAPLQAQAQYVTIWKGIWVKLNPTNFQGSSNWLYDKTQQTIANKDNQARFFKRGAKIGTNTGTHASFYKFTVEEMTAAPTGSPTGAPTRACLDSAELEAVIDEYAYNATTGYLDEIKLCDDVTSFDGLFFGIDETLEYPIGGWDTSGITSMVETFMNNTKFNSDISGWDMSSVKTLDNMFHGSISFNQDLSSWDTSSVKNLYRTFLSAKSFNQDISAWDVSSVVNFKETFANSGFNQDLSTWEISKGLSFYAMFNWAEKFRQNLCWDISNDASTSLMFSNAGGGTVSC